MLYCLPTCHVTLNQHQRAVNVQKSYFIIKLLILQVHIFGERRSDDTQKMFFFYVFGETKAFYRH